jgi:hypothetical protein
MRKLTLNPDLLAVQSFGIDSPDLDQPTIGTHPDSPLCAPSVPYDCP